MKEIFGLMTSMGIITDEQHFTTLFSKPIVKDTATPLMSLHRVHAVIGPHFLRWCDDKHIDMDGWPTVAEQFIKPLDEKTLKWALLSCIQHY